MHRRRTCSSSRCKVIRNSLLFEFTLRPGRASRSFCFLSSKSEVRIAKQIRMSKEEAPKRFDLEERTFAFAKRARALVKTLEIGRASCRERAEVSVDDGA